MPPARPRAQGPSAGALVAMGLVVLLLAVVLFVFVIHLLSTTGGQGLAGRSFKAGKATRLAEAARLRPVAFTALSGSKDVLLLHTGDRADAGWRAVGAAPPGLPRRCLLDWDANDRSLVEARCEPHRRYREDGEGLTVYPVTVDADGNVVVDLRSPRPGPIEPSPPPPSIP